MILKYYFEILSGGIILKSYRAVCVLINLRSGVFKFADAHCAPLHHYPFVIRFRGRLVTAPTHISYIHQIPWTTRFTKATMQASDQISTNIRFRGRPRRVAPTVWFVRVVYLPPLNGTNVIPSEPRENDTNECSVFNTVLSGPIIIFNPANADFFTVTVPYPNSSIWLCRT